METFEKCPGLILFSEEVLSSTEKCIMYMRKKNLLKSSMICECGQSMRLCNRKDISDGQVWLCIDSGNCTARLSIRTGSYSQAYQCEKLFPDVSEKSTLEWYSLFRDVCSHALLNNPVKLGNGITTNVVEIDESLFGKKRKYNKGTGNQKYWVFGMWQRNTRNAVLELVVKRDRATLLPIIKKYVVQGSTLYSDQWAAYNTLHNEGYGHSTVNHSVEFVSDSGTCTNGIEGLWGLAKLRIKKMKEILPVKLPGILDEFMYRYRFGNENGGVYHILLQHISECKC